jgi:hypothetical protein
MEETMTFGEALVCIKEGRKVTRKGWNGKGMFIFLVFYTEGTEIKYLAHIDMKTADGQVVPWVASQTDLLAEDWQVAP